MPSLWAKYFFDQWNSLPSRTACSIYLLSIFFRFGSVGNVPVTLITTNLFYLCYKFMSLVPGLFMKNDNKRTAGFLQSRKCFYFSSDFFFLSLRLFASRGQKQMTTFELFGSSACKAASPTKSHLVRPQVVVRNMKTPCFALPFGWACVQQVGEKKIYFIRSLFARILYRVERF